MTPQQAVGLGIRLFAIWLALQTLQHLIFVPAQMTRAGVEGIAPAIMIAIGYFAAALALWFYPMVVAHAIVPRTRYAEPMKPQLTDLARVGCALLGIWLLARTLPALARFLYGTFLMVGSGSAFGTLSTDAKLDVAYYVVELGLALFLIFRSETAGNAMLRAGSARPAAGEAAD
jgi:hypothetical protein